MIRLSLNWYIAKKKFMSKPILTYYIFLVTPIVRLTTENLLILCFKL